ncbi:MAG: hypothetical protein ABIL86_09930 [candidate division WOR-3 bacterium]
MKKTSFLFGTRPEAIRLAPVILDVRQIGLLKMKCSVNLQNFRILDLH